MSIGSFIKKETDKVFGHDAAKSVETFIGNEFDRAVVAAKSTEIGPAALSAAHAVEDPTLTGEQKMVKAIALVAPVVIKVAAGGFSGVAADAETFARAVLESTLTDVKQTKALSIAKAVLAIVGKK